MTTTMPPKSQAYTSPVQPTRITLDPTNATNSKVMRTALILECLSNFSFLPLITHPHIVLTHLLASPLYITPATILFTRLLSLLCVGGLTVGLAACIPNTKMGIEARKPMYLLLGMGEVLFIGLFVWEVGSDDRVRAVSDRVCWVAIVSLMIPLVWRGYVLYVKPDLLGRYREVEGVGEKKKE